MVVLALPTTVRTARVAFPVVFGWWTDATRRPACNLHLIGHRFSFLDRQQPVEVVDDHTEIAVESTVLSIGKHTDLLGTVATSTYQIRLDTFRRASIEATHNCQGCTESEL